MTKKQSLKATIIPIFFLNLIFSAFLFSCKTDIESEQPNDSTQTTQNTGNPSSEKKYCKVKLSVEVEESERSIVPIYKMEDYYYQFYLWNLDSSDADVITYPAEGQGMDWDTFRTREYTLMTGSYMIGANVYSDSSCSPSSQIMGYSSDEMTIDETTTNLSIVLKETEQTNIKGSFSVIFEFPSLADFESIKVKIVSVTALTTAVAEDTLTMETQADGTKTVTYSKSGLANGTYFLFLILTNHRGQKTFIPKRLTIARGMESKPYSENTTTTGRVIVTEEQANLLYEKYISSSGSDTTGTGAYNKPFATLSKAIASINSDNLPGKDWLICVNGAISGNTTISDVKAKKLTISGKTGSSTDKLSGNNSGTVVTVESSVPIIFEKLAITNGKDESESGAGGGLNIKAGSTVTIKYGCSIIGNSATSGGGIYNAGILKMTGGSVSNNTATLNGGGIFNDATGKIFLSGSALIGDIESEQTSESTSYSNKTTGSGSGGGIYTTGSVYIGYIDEDTADTAFSGGVCHNYSHFAGGGIYSEGANNIIKMSSGSIKYNGSYSDGAGIRLGGNSDTFEMTGGSVSGNIANWSGGSGGGAVYIGGPSTAKLLGGTISSNNAYPNKGKAVCNNGGSLILGGNIYIPTTDDIYLKTADAKISLASPLTAETPGAIITPAVYSTDTQVLSLAAGSTTTIADECGKFSVTTSSTDGTWTVSETGYLQHCVVLSPTETANIQDPSVPYYIKGAGDGTNNQQIDIRATSSDCTYYITLDNVYRDAPVNASAMMIYNDTGNVTLTVYITLIGENTLIGYNHGGIQIQGATSSTVRVIFNTVSSGSLKFDSYSTAMTDIRVDTSVGNPTVEFGIASGNNFSGTINDVNSYATPAAFFAASKTSTDGSKLSLTKRNAASNGEYVSIVGGTFNGSATLSSSGETSSVFIAGRSLTIRNLIAGVTELTQDEYEKYCKYGKLATNVNTPPNSNYNTGSSSQIYPAYGISFYDMLVYCNLRSLAEGLTPAYALSGETDPTKWSGIVGNATEKYCGPSSVTSTWDAVTFDTSANGWRLPTEAEWEYLARGGNLTNSGQTTYSGSNVASEVGWYSGDNNDNPTAVKQKTPNALGLYDMSGNVFELCWDWNGTISASTPATGNSSGSERMVRGGGCTYASSFAAVSHRGVDNTSEMRWANCGARIVRNAP